jgi:hypothetical protein
VPKQALAAVVFTVTDGMAVTVTPNVTDGVQPVLYVTVVAPVDTDVITPVAALITATAGALLVHTPPATLLESVALTPEAPQIRVGPDIAAGAEVPTITVKVVVSLKPQDEVAARL